MRGEVVERTLDQLADRLAGRQACQIELALLRADLLVHPFEDRKIERVLVAEIMVDELLVDARARGDLVDAGAGKSAVGELTSRRGEQLATRGFGIAPLRLLAVGSSIGHFQPDS